jgi:uncharacterized peroxidase-related enzyme
MYVTPIAPEDAQSAVREMYDEDVRETGFVWNDTKLFSLNPAAYRAFHQLLKVIRGTLDHRRFELATIAAARALRCRNCVSAHSDALMKSNVFDRAQMEAIVRDFRTAGLTPVEVAIMSLSEKVALHAYKVTPEEIDELRGFGLTDTEIFNITLSAAARCFVSKTIDAMGIEPDEEFTATNDLIDLIELVPQV